MRQNFRGWNTVFGFTFRQSTKGKGFKVVTILVVLLILAASIIFNLIAAKPDKQESDTFVIEHFPIERVYVLDNSGLAQTNYKELNPFFEQEQFSHIEFNTVEGLTRKEAIQLADSDELESIVVLINTSSTGYDIEFLIPPSSASLEFYAEMLVDPICSAFETNKLLQSGLSQEQLSAALKPVVTSYGDIGEVHNPATIAIKMIAPMLFGLMLYFMLLIYGQTVSKSVSTEKTSRLMETLLITIHPYALIAGKVLAVTVLAIMQFLIWIIALIGSLYVGNGVAQAVYPEYENSAITIINFLKDNIGESALTIPAFILCVIAFFIGFLFYSVIAGLAGCMVSKPEDVASTQAIFQFPVIISWLVCYFAPVLGNETLQTVVRYIPFTAPFSIPVDILTGTIGLVEGLITVLLLTFFTVIVVMISGKIYKGLILYTGQKVNLKTIGNIITNKN